MKVFKNFLPALAFVLAIVGAFVTNASHNDQQHTLNAPIDVNVKPVGGSTCQLDNIDVGECQLGSGPTCTVMLGQTNHEVFQADTDGSGNPVCINQYYIPD